jgi:YggT family protein
MGSAFAEALIFIVSNLGGLYLIAVMLRFLLQAARADFYNPLCQTIVKVTAPLRNPLHRVIPSWKRLDLASLVLALLLNAAFTAVMVYGTGNALSFGQLVSWGLVGLLSLTLDIYFYAMLVVIIASFFSPFSGHPVLLLTYQLLQPFYKIAHRILPPMGGLDLSPLLLMLVIKVVEILVVTPLANGLNVFPAVVIGL